jgi:tetratricopeptide (TPR) repeat protein
MPVQKTILEQNNDTVRQARILKNLARLLLRDNQLDAAEDAASRAIDLISDKGHEFLLCQLHRALGRIHRSKGEKEKAIHHFKTALGIASRFNWRDDQFWNHYHLADLFCDQGEFDDANTHIEQAKSHVVGVPYSLACAMFMQARVSRWQGRFKDAKSEVSQALEVFEKLGAASDAGNSRKVLREIDLEMMIYSITSQL